MGTRGARYAPALLLVAGLTLCGCSGASDVDTTGGSSSSPAVSTSPSAPPSPSPSVSASASASAQDNAILGQYRAFFASLTPLSKKPSKVRFEAMKKLAVDPELTRVLGGMAASEAVGEVGYGTPTTRPSIERVSGPTAELTDCQDTSSTGRLKTATRKKLTVGRKNDLAKVTMRRGADGIWRIATVQYAPAGSCSATT